MMQPQQPRYQFNETKIWQTILWVSLFCLLFALIGAILTNFGVQSFAALSGGAGGLILLAVINLRAVKSTPAQTVQHKPEPAASPKI